MTDDEPQPWERQPGETDKAFAAFCTYRDLGPGRSVAATGEILGKTRGTLEPWQAKFKWVVRASKWDDESDRLMRERNQVERAAAHQRMLDDNVSLGRAMKSIAAKGFRQFDQEIDPDHPHRGRKIDKLSAADLARYAQVGASMEREGREGSQSKMDEREAKAWLEGFVDLALQYLPAETHEAFLSDMDAKLGTGSMGVR